MCDQAGIATLIMMAMTDRRPVSAAMAYPASATVLRCGKPMLAFAAKFMGLL